MWYDGLLSTGRVGYGKALNYPGYLGQCMVGRVFYLGRVKQGKYHTHVFYTIPNPNYLFCLCWGFTAQSTTRSCRAGQLIVALFLGRLRPSKRLTSTKRGRPRQ